MRFLKALIVVLWLLATTLFIIGALTPLDFRHRMVGFLAFFITFNGVFSIRYLLTSYIRIKWDRFIITFLISMILIVTYIVIPGQDWKTQEIMYRQKGNPDNVIASQMERIGPGQYNHRIVKMMRITPFFNYSKELDKVQLDENSWDEVHEYVNELGITKDSVKLY